jgi:hypothetical protein
VDKPNECVVQVIEGAEKLKEVLTEGDFDLLK